MISNELMEIINIGKCVPVEMLKTIEDCEMRYEEGMRAYIVKANEDNGGCIIFQTEEREFAEYNKSVEKPIWFNSKSGTYDLKWSELEPHISEYDLQIWQDVDTEIYSFKILDDSKFKLFQQYKKENSELTYVQWLEEKVFELV